MKKKHVAFYLVFVMLLSHGAALASAETLTEESAQPAVIETGGLTLEIPPEYDELITVETPEDDARGILFRVSETASLEIGGFDGAGWLFSVGKLGADELHEMLCHDMSGAYVFARAENGDYYMLYHPTDVRYVRASTEDMIRDQDQWSMLCEWAADVPDGFAEKNGLERVSYGNTEVDMALARAAWGDDAGVTLSTTEYGPVEIKGVDGSPYAESVLRCGFSEADPDETPDGQYVVLNFPEEEFRLDFFFAPGAYVRAVSGERETLYQAERYDEYKNCAREMQRWYYAALMQLLDPEGVFPGRLPVSLPDVDEDGQFVEAALKPAA